MADAQRTGPGEGDGGPSVQGASANLDKHRARLRRHAVPFFLRMSGCGVREVAT